VTLFVGINNKLLFADQQVLLVQTEDNLKTPQELHHIICAHNLQT